MVSAKFEIKGEKYTIEWPSVELNLFHQINRIIDLELGIEQEQNVYFNNEDYRLVKEFVLSHIWLNPINKYDSTECVISLDGYKITLKNNKYD